MSQPLDIQTPLVLVSELRGRMNADFTKADVNGRLLEMSLEQSQIFSQACRRRFDEFIETRYYTPFHVSMVHGSLLDLRTLLLDMDLKSAPAATVVINGDGAQIATGNMQFLPTNRLYKQYIRLNPYGIQFWYHAGVTDPIGSISVNGTWGFGGQWMPTGATLSTGMLIGDTTLTSTGTALEAGMVLALFDGGTLPTEYMYVSTAGSPNAVMRAFNGSTAIAHPTTGQAIFRWTPLKIVKQVVTRFIQLALEQDKSPLFGQQVIGDTSLPVAVDEWPKDILRTVKAAGLIRLPRLQAV